MDSNERLVRVEGIRIPITRESNGSCLALATSIRDQGLRQPITVWPNGTLISGQRRIVAHMLLKLDRIPAVFVNTIEDAAKRMLVDNLDVDGALPWKWKEVCRLWEMLRRLDEPAAVKRAADARTRGVELRRKSIAGQRKPGRAARSDDYVLSVICEPFGISAATAKRIETIHAMATGARPVPDGQRQLARECLADIDDEGGSIWANYQRLIGGRRTAAMPRPKLDVQVPSAPAARQVAAWSRSLPQMEGLLAGLVELGSPHTSLTWEQVGPVHARLSAVRRELERMIKQMRENNES